MFELVELLNQVNNQIFQMLSPIVKSKDITISELILLWKINKRGPYRITDLAREAGAPASTLTGVIDRFESKKYIIRIHNSKDRRSVLIQGTEKLNDMIISLIKNADKELSDLLNELEPEFTSHLAQDLSTLQKYLTKKGIEKK
ncbi:MAG: MarR family winged helix-turn-helix transcriptional regulator [Acetobacterium sp.]